MTRQSDGKFSGKVACACVFAGVFVCYLVSTFRQAGQMVVLQNVIEVYRAFDPPSRAKPEKPEMYRDFTCDEVTKHSNKMCTMLPPQDFRSMTPPTYLRNYKNPCWKTEEEDQPIRCMPYFYLLGVPRCATTDLYYRMAEHPQIAFVDIRVNSELSKEIQWLTKGRYAFPTVDGSSHSPTINNMTDWFVNASAEIYATQDKNLYHKKIFGDFSVSTFWDNMFAAKYASSTNTTALRNAESIHALYPKTKFIVSIRDPVERAWGDYLFFDKEGKKSREIFHALVVSGNITHSECLQFQPLQYCIDYRPNNKGKSGRLFIGLYHQHFLDFFEYFPRTQFYIFKVEDYAKDMRKYLTQMYTFLGLAEVAEEHYAAMLNVTYTLNVQKKENLALGDMLPETRALLEEFYTPYNDLLGQLIGQEFNYNKQYSNYRA